MSPLRIRMKKGRDGPNSLVMIREDGSHTRQHQRQPFFAVHDLTHYAVETTLGHRRGFYVLIAEGWDLEDFGAPWPKGPLPDDLDPSELIVGFLDLERATGFDMTPDDLNEKVAAWLRERGLAGALPVVSAAQLEQTRGLMRDLILQWYALPPGETLELTFVTPAVPEVAGS